MNVQDIWYAVSDRHHRNCDKVHIVAKVMTRNGRKIKVKGFKSFRRKTNSIPLPAYHPTIQPTVSHILRVSFTTVSDLWK